LCLVKLKMLSKIIQFSSRNPKFLFLSDATGALVTALSWLVWKLFFAEQFNFHNDVLSGLIFYAVAMFCASMQFYLFAKKDYGSCIKFLVFGNICFVIILINLLYFFWNEISIFPKFYIAMEILIIFMLALLEVKVKKEISLICLDHLLIFMLNKYSL